MLHAAGAVVDAPVEPVGRSRGWSKCFKWHKNVSGGARAIQSAVWMDEVERERGGGKQLFLNQGSEVRATHSDI